MWTRIQPSAIVAFFAATLFLLPHVGADDSNEPDNQNQETARIEREFAQKVEKYNTLLKQGRFDEAIALGKVARLLQPENPMGELMVLKAKFAKQDAVNSLPIKFKATVAADIAEVPDGSNTIEQTLQTADGTIRGLLYGKDEDTDDGRCLLDASLERRIEAVHLICRLADTQKRKLRLAGRGDIKRFFDRVKALRPKFQQTDAVPDDDPPDQGLCGNAYLFRADAMRRGGGVGLFEQGSLFSKTLRMSLTESQAAAFEAANLQRPEPRK